MVHWLVLILTLVLIAGTVIASFPALTYASTLTIQPDGTNGQDTWLEYLSDTNHGNESGLTVTQAGYINGSNTSDFGLIKFPLLSIPRGAVISDAKAVVTSNYGFDIGEAPDIVLYRVTSNWDEASATGNNMPTVDTGDTYKATVANPPSTGEISFTVTKLVQDWVAGTVTNYGFRLGFVIFSTPSQRVFDASESAATTARPKLVVTYSVPAASPSPTPSSTPTAGPLATPTPTPAAKPGGSSVSVTPTPSAKPVSSASVATPSGGQPAPKSSSQTITTCRGLKVTTTAETTGLSIDFSTPKSVVATVAWDETSHTDPPGLKKKATSDYPPANRLTESPSRDHHLKVSGLASNTDYYYSLFFSDGSQDCEDRLTTTSLALAAPLSAKVGPISAIAPAPSALPLVRPGLNSATTAGAATAAVSLATFGPSVAQALVELAQAASTVPQVVTANWLNLLALFGLRQKRYPWGRVLDAISARPLAGALVTIHDQDSYGRVADRAVSDRAGRFGFLVEPGHYSLWVKKAGFTFPSDIRPESYRGSRFGIGNERMIVLDLFVDPLEIKKRWRASLNRFASRLEIARRPILALGTVLAAVNFLTRPALPAALLLGLYGLLWWFEYRLAHHGRYTFKLAGENGRALAFVVFRLIDATGRVALAKATNAEGEAYVLVPGGAYRLEIVLPGNIVITRHVNLPRGLLWQDMAITTSRAEGVKAT